jgi:hypothetical protein
MKQLPVILLLGMALSLCNLMNKSKNSNTSGSGSPGSGSSSSSSGITAEKPQPTAAESAAIAGGQPVSWDEQGITWTVPQKWTKNSQDKNNLLWHSPGGSEAANLIGTISPMNDDFPTEVSIKATYESSQQRMKRGEVDQVRWLEIDGVKGVQFRESNPDKPDGIRRMQWIAFRKYAGIVQQVNIMLSSNGKGFPEHKDEMYGVLYSMKLVH